MASYGSPHWAGSRQVAYSVGPKRLAVRYGAFISSKKRPKDHPLSISNPASDHNEANTGAYAIDFATFNGSRLAHAIARKLGIQNYSTGNFNAYIIHRRGATFRVQILWGVKNHFNHVHLGVKIIAGDYDLVERPPVIKARRKSYGKWGRLLKRRLRKRGHKGIWIGNGLYRPGSRAEKAVKKLQRNHNLRPDGIVGPKTWNLLGE